MKGINTDFLDLTPEACRLVSEGFANEAKYSDGEIVANILRYPEHSVDANQWWARLDKSKPRTLKKILGHPTLGPAFKKVLSIPGLRPGLLLAPWHKILNCVEVGFLKNSRHLTLFIFSLLTIDFLGSHPLPWRDLPDVGLHCRV